MACSALPTDLWRPIHWEQANLLSHLNPRIVTINFTATQPLKCMKFWKVWILKKKKNEQTKAKNKIWEGWPWMYKKWLNYWLKYTYSNLNLLSVPNLCFLQFQYPHLHNDSIFDFFPYMFALRVRPCMFPLPCSIPCKVTALFVLFPWRQYATKWILISSGVWQWK